VRMPALTSGTRRDGNIGVELHQRVAHGGDIDVEAEGVEDLMVSAYSNSILGVISIGENPGRRAAAAAEDLVDIGSPQLRNHRSTSPPQRASRVWPERFASGHAQPSKRDPSRWSLAALIDSPATPKLCDLGQVSGASGRFEPS
jgi:hypothetical protein